MSRPSAVVRSSSTVVFHLREVVSSLTDEDAMEETLWLFGNRADRVSVAIRVDGFRPYLFLGYDDDVAENLESWISSVNEGCLDGHGEKRMSKYCLRHGLDEGSEVPIITGVTVVDRTPVVGFSKSRTRRYFRVEYRNHYDIWVLRSVLKSGIVVPGKDVPTVLSLYHDDWGVESMFLHTAGLKLQEWVSASGLVKTTRLTTCGTEFCVSSWRSLVPCDTVPTIPPVLCCSVRLFSSSDGCNVPVASNAEDRVLAVSLRFYWMGDGTEEAETVTLSGPSEIVVLDRFFSEVERRDVDCFVMLSDMCDPLLYIAKRSKQRGVRRVQFSKLRVLSRPFRYTKKLGEQRLRSKCNITWVNMSGRSVMDMKFALQKMMVEPKLDGYTLLDAALHPSLIRDNSETVDPSVSQRASTLPLEDVVLHCEKESRLQAQMDRDNSMLLGFLEISSASFTSVTDVVCRGQQIRVWNKLISQFFMGDLLVNKEMLNCAPVVVRRSVSDSSFPDPPYVPNVPISGEVQETEDVFSTMIRCRDLFGKVVSIDSKKPKTTSVKKPKRYQGGYVCDPDTGFYLQPTFTFDFASLYPSIIQGYDICYMRLLFDRNLLDDPELEFSYVPINEHECIVLVNGIRREGVLEPCRTILPRTIKEVCEERTRAKKLMKSATDPFVKEVMNAKQLGCKVFQNAVYGFLGVEKHAMLACPVLMASVCRIGQYMIKSVRHLLISRHRAHIVYGDTDSVMVQFPDGQLRDGEDRPSRLDMLYTKCHEVAVQCTGLFPFPNMLEFESMKLPFWMYKKKNYAAMEYGLDWRKGSEMVIKGLPFKKRDRCPLVRRIGYAIIDMILSSRSEEIEGYLAHQLMLLAEGGVPMSEFIITCLMQREETYKNKNLIQYETAKRTCRRTGKPWCAGMRLSYVVCRGEQPLYGRGEDPSYVLEHSIPLDLAYYMDKQLLSAVEPLLQFHPLIDIRKCVQNAKRKIELDRMKVRSLPHMLVLQNQHVKRVKLNLSVSPCLKKETAPPPNGFVM